MAGERADTLAAANLAAQLEGARKAMAGPGVEPKTRAAHIADLITAYCGIVCTVDGSLDGVKHMVEFMVNRHLKMFQLGRAADTVMPALAEQFPWLPLLTPPDTDGQPRLERRDAVLAWVDQVAGEHGLVHRVQRLPEGVWEGRDPIEEYRGMLAPGATVVAVMPVGDSIETFTNPAPGLFRNPPPDEDGDGD